MKYTILILISFTFFYSQIFAQQKTFSEPSEWVYYKTDQDEFMEPMYDKLFPIGFSKEGLFAYIVEPADEACGCYFMNFIITNLKTDNVVWEFKYEGSLEDYLEEQENMKSIWKKNKLLFEEKLNTFGIIQQKSIKLEKFPVHYSGNGYKATLNSYKKEKEDWGIEVVVQNQIWLTSSRSGKKMVFNEAFSTDNFILSANISGFIKSPYEDRIAIMLKQERRGWEGPPNVISFQFIGAHLTDGNWK